jgi:hypothetical protein
MKNLYDPASAAEVRARIASLSPASPRQWGRMTVAQALAHLAASLEWAVGDQRPPRMMLGYVFGPIAKARTLRDEKPIPRNTPTAPELLVRDDRDLERERRRLLALVDRFTAGGPAGCTTHPHTFFGRMAPDEVSVLLYKHLDHHLRQFSA